MKKTKTNPIKLLLMWPILFLLILYAATTSISYASGGPTVRYGKIYTPHWGPISGAKLWSTMGEDWPAWSDEQGDYAVGYYIPPCPGFSFSYPSSIFAKMYYQNFNPKEKSSRGSYFARMPTVDHCFGFHEYTPYGSGTLFGVTNQLIMKSFQPQIDPIYNIDFEINVAVLSGVAVLTNDFRTDLSVGEYLDEAIPLNAATEYSYSQPVFTPFGGNSIRQPDIIPDFSNLGLLKTISAEDLDDTDIYVYSLSTGDLITSREGLHLEDRQAGKNFIYYAFLLSGPQLADIAIGEPVKIVIVNRPTGYIGTGIAVRKPSDDSSLISFSPDLIAMRPPNLIVNAHRKHEVEAGLTAGEDRYNIIGFEGSALTSDDYVAITTEWFDVDGSLLPSDLPGYTGRLAKVDAINRINGQIANFMIQPGQQVQLLRLHDKESDNAHYYVHISGEPTTGSPGFSEAEFGQIGAGEGPLQYRPKSYVPLRVPVFDEQKTRDNANQQALAKSSAWQTGQSAPVLEDIEKVYAYPYRPEMQFSLFKLPRKKMEMTTVLDPEIGWSTTMSLDYDLYSDPSLDPLDRFGPERQLIFGLGWAELLALVGTEQHLEFPNVEQLMAMTPAVQLYYLDDALNRLQPEDFLGLQLYQTDDAGNGLFEYYGLPLLVAQSGGFKLVKNHFLSKFDPPLGDLVDIGLEEDFKSFNFYLTQAANVMVNLLDSDQEAVHTLIPETPLAQGNFNFSVDFDSVKNAGFDPDISPQFYIQLAANTADGLVSQNLQIPGMLEEKSIGRMLGQIVVHDVLIQDGSLNLSRQDLALKGRGPELAFTRTYSNLPAGKGPHLLGPGWRHSLDMELSVFSVDDSERTKQLLGRFYLNGEIPDYSEDWSVVSVNGTIFQKHNGQWHPERGRHGTLEKSGESFVYTAKDGTSYTYDYPKRPEVEASPVYTDPLFMSIGDGLTTRIGLDPSNLYLPSDADVVYGSHPADPLKPTQVRKIEDRNRNTMTFHYGDGDLLEKVVDAVGRSVTFTYEPLEPANPTVEDLLRGLMRLRRVSASGGIKLSFSYDEQGFLSAAKRGPRAESYAYAQELELPGGDYNLVAATNSLGQSYNYAYYKDGDIGSNLSTFIKAIKSRDMVRRVYYPDDNYAVFTYDIDTYNRRSVKDLRGNTTTYNLNLYGNPTKIAEPEGKTTRMTWSIDEPDGTDNVMTSRTDGRNLTTYYRYDSKGNVVHERIEGGPAITTDWNLNFSLPTSRTDRNGITQSWQYDGDGNLIRYIDGDGKEFSYTNYGTGERKTRTDPRQNTTRYTYDQLGNPDTILAPEGSLTNFDHDIRGRRIAMTDPNGHKTNYTYDTLDYPQKIIHPPISPYSLPEGSSNIETFDYNAEGNLLAETDRLGLTLNYTYTDRNQVDAITRNIGGQKNFDYDPNGNLTSETDWKDVATTHTYDDLNRRKTTTNRLGDTMRLAYDLADNLIKVEDYEGRITNHEHDALNRIVKTLQPALDGQERGTIEYTYYNEADPQTNLKTETDPEGNTTTYGYNGRYLRTKRINALSDEYIWQYDDSGNLAREINERNKYTRYEYDKQNRLIYSYQQFEDREIKTGYAYDANGNRTHTVDARNNDTEVKYDEWNRAYQLIDPDNYATTTEFDGSGNPVKLVDGNRHERTWQRDRRGLVLTAVDAENHLTDYAYDLNGNVLTVTDANDVVTQNTYDAEDRLLTATEAFGTPQDRTREIVSRDRMGNITAEKDFNGNVRTTEYNVLNLVKKAFDPAPFDSRYIEYAYYKTGQVKSVTNRRGHATNYEYDELNRERRVTDAAGNFIKTTYDEAGNVDTVQDKRGIITANTYDDLNRLIEVKRAGVTIVQNEYDDVGNLRFVTDANRNQTEHTYNKRNLLATTIYPDSDIDHPDGFTETRTYDGVGNLLTLTDEEAKVTTYNYDKENRQIYVEFAGEVTTRMYDAVGNLTSVTKPEGNCRIMAYDRFNRLVTVVDDPTAPIGTMTALDPRCNKSDGLNQVTRYEYDPNGNLRHQYDPLDNQVEFTYDQVDRKTSHIQHKAPDNLIVQYTQHDENGNLTEMYDAKGQLFTYEYDELDRQIIALYPDDSEAVYLNIVQIQTEYDENNNVAKVTETKQTIDSATLTDVTINKYDDFDRLDDSTQRGLTIDYGYDANGNRTLVSSAAGTTNYTYDSRNRIITADADGDETRYTYYPDGKADTVVYPNGTEIKYTYHPTNRVETITNKTSANQALISSYDYEYDKNGNRMQQIEVQDGVSESTSYTYDALDRLTDFQVDDGTLISATEYTYQGYNRKTEKVTENNNQIKSRTYFYDQTNWLTQIEDNTDSQNAFTIDYVYDKNGNTVLKSDSSLTNKDITFSYDSRNQLVQLIRGPPGSEVLLGQYDYNAAGLRVRHRFSERGDVDYFYDANAVLEEHNAVDDSLLAHYRYADRLLRLDNAGDTQYYHHDALGSTVNLTTDTGTVQVTYRLDPWGHVRSQSGDSVNRQIFTSQEHDINTGLIYFGARYYDPDTARFITQDSYLGEPNTPPSLHRYLYAYSNPTVYFDPNGNVTILKNGADALSDFNEWLRDRDFGDLSYGGIDAALGLFGQVTSGVTRAAVSAGEGFLRGVNYAANWGSIAFEPVITGIVGDDDWAYEHAREIRGTHQTVAGIVTYLKHGGVADIAKKGVATIEKAAEGDFSAIGDVTEFVGGFALGGGSGTGAKISNTGRQLTQTVFSTSKNIIKTASVAGTKQVIKKSAEQFTRIVPKISGELKRGLHSTGREILETKAGQLSSFGYTRKKLSSHKFQATVKSFNYGQQRLLFTGRQQHRAKAIIDEAAQAVGIKLSNYIDDVVFTTGNAPFFTVINGRRVIALNKSTLRKTSAGQLIDAVHELSHARHARKLGYQKYMQMYGASIANRARIEVLVESRALNTVRRYFGELTPQQKSWSSRYIKDWEKYVP